MRTDAGEVVGRVLDGVLHVVRRHLDRELDLVLSEGLDRVRHQLSHYDQTPSGYRPGPWT